MQSRPQSPSKHQHRSFRRRNSSRVPFDQSDSMKTSSPSCAAKNAALSMEWQIRRCWKPWRGWTPWTCGLGSSRAGGETCHGLREFPMAEGMSGQRWSVGATGRCERGLRWSWTSGADWLREVCAESVGKVEDRGMGDVGPSAAASRADHPFRLRDWRWGRGWRTCVIGSPTFLPGLYRILARVVQSLLAPPDEFGDGDSARWLVDIGCRWVLARTWIVILVATVANEHPRYPENPECSELSRYLVFERWSAFRVRDSHHQYSGCPCSNVLHPWTASWWRPPVFWVS